MSARTDALMSRQEGKIAASIVSVVAGCHPVRALRQHARRRLFPVFPEEDISGTCGHAQDKRIDFQEHSSL